MAVVVDSGSAVMTVTGGLAALRVGRYCHLVLGLATGLMLGVVGFELLPGSLRQNRIGSRVDLAAMPLAHDEHKEPLSWTCARPVPDDSGQGDGEPARDVRTWTGRIDERICR